VCSPFDSRNSVTNEPKCKRTFPFVAEFQDFVLSRLVGPMRRMGCGLTGRRVLLSTLTKNSFQLRSFCAAKTSESPAPAVPAPKTVAPQPAAPTAEAAAPAADRLHSTDIAFKPNADGWGYTPRYATAWDRIFAKKQGGEVTTAKTKTGAPGSSDVDDATVRRLVAEIAKLTPEQRATVLREAASLKQ
jgi:hypothetical protein